MLTMYITDYLVFNTQLIFPHQHEADKIYSLILTEAPTMHWMFLIRSNV